MNAVYGSVFSSSNEVVLSDDSGVFVKLYVEMRHGFN
jgi:hypothetical protein